MGILALTIFLILLILSANFAVGYAVNQLLSLAGLQLSINLPVEFRLAGLALLVVGVTMGSAVMTVRRPLDILVSTSETFMKLLGRKPVGEMTRRTEPFIPKGPYRFVRNPMYFSLLTLIFGFGLVNSSTALLLWALVLTCWFWLIEVPFEEKELQALFGESYTDYKRQVPMLFPYGKKYKPKTQTGTKSETIQGERR